MLKLVRRPLTEFLDVSHRESLKNRVDSAQQLALDAGRTSAEKSRNARQQWDAFRAGRTSRGTFDALWIELCAMAFNKCALCETPSPGTVEHMEEKSRAPERTFDWENLLAACDTCNRNRQNSGVAAKPLDPSGGLEPLDYFGWDEYGDFAASPKHEATVRDLVVMYGLDRFREERCSAVKILRALLSALVNEEAKTTDTLEALRVVLDATRGWRGPVREYLLRPPTENDKLLVAGALHFMPEIQKLVEPWLRPPLWAQSQWV